MSKKGGMRGKQALPGKKGPPSAKKELQPRPANASENRHYSKTRLQRERRTIGENIRGLEKTSLDLGEKSRGAVNCAGRRTWEN